MVVESEVLKAQNCALSKFSLPMHSNEENAAQQCGLFRDNDNRDQFIKRVELVDQEEYDKNERTPSWAERRRQ